MKGCSKLLREQCCLNFFTSSDCFHPSGTASHLPCPYCHQPQSECRNPSSAATCLLWAPLHCVRTCPMRPLLSDYRGFFYRWFFRYCLVLPAFRCRNRHLHGRQTDRDAVRRQSIPDGDRDIRERLRAVPILIDVGFRPRPGKRQSKPVRHIGRDEDPSSEPFLRRSFSDEMISVSSRSCCPVPACCPPSFVSRTTGVRMTKSSRMPEKTSNSRTDTFW